MVLAFFVTFAPIASSFFEAGRPVNDKVRLKTNDENVKQGRTRPFQAICWGQAYRLSFPNSFHSGVPLWHRRQDNQSGSSNHRKPLSCSWSIKNDVKIERFSTGLDDYACPPTDQAVLRNSIRGDVGFFHQE